MSTGLRIGLLGSGAISAKYLDTFRRMPQLELVACADLVRERSADLARRWGQPIRVCEPAELLASNEVDLVLNLTVPTAHAETADAALECGKHVYVEKPLATTVEAAEQLVAKASGLGLRVGCAPDTVLGTGVQTARAVIEQGRIGRPTAAIATLLGTGPDNRHPNPHFFYQPGAGPLLDMGPYYLTTLVTLLGPVQRVSALGHASSRTRPIIEGPNAGGSIEVNVNTHVSATLEHADGALSTLVTSFDVPAGSRLPRIEIFGTHGTLGVPDPNQFHGDVVTRADRGSEWAVVPATAGFVEASRGIGVADLADSLAVGVPHRASAELAAHVVEVLSAIERSVKTLRAVDIVSSPPIPAAVGLTPANQVLA